MPTKPVAGFTLLELLIAVAVISILAAFAIPSYLAQVEKGRQTDGQELMTRILQSQERYFTENLTYTLDLQDLGYNKEMNIPSEEGYYKARAITCKSPYNSIDSCVRIRGKSQTGGKNLLIDSMGNKNW